MQRLIVHLSLLNRDQSGEHRKSCGHYLKLAECFEQRQASTKIMIMIDLLRQIKSRPGNEKTIVFSTFTSMLTIIEPFLQKERIEFVRC